MENNRDLSNVENGVKEEAPDPGTTFAFYFIADVYPLTVLS
jgi:hypothetical protein